MSFAEEWDALFTLREAEVLAHPLDDETEDEPFVTGWSSGDSDDLGEATRFELWGLTESAEPLATAHVEPEGSQWAWVVEWSPSDADEQVWRSSNGDDLRSALDECTHKAMDRIREH
jgi:hypothetical protein